MTAAKAHKQVPACETCGSVPLHGEWSKPRIRQGFSVSHALAETHIQSALVQNEPSEGAKFCTLNLWREAPSNSR
jgi:hypothetical protein